MAKPAKRSKQDLVDEILAIADEFMLQDNGAQKCGKSLMYMLTLITDFCKNGEFVRAQHVCEMATSVNLLAGEYQGGLDMFFAQGVVHYFMAATLIGTGDEKRAFEHFHQSSEKLKHLYPIPAAAVWLGAAELHSNLEEYDKAVWALQRSTNLADKSPATRRSLELLREQIRNSYARSIEGLEDSARSDPPRTWRGTKSAKPSLYALEVFPVFGDLAAGRGIWMNPSVGDIDYVEIERLRINGTLYRILNLRDEGFTLRLEKGKQYGVSQIKGNSMNNLTRKVGEPLVIESGDYVLLCASVDGQHDPKDSEVVSATVDDISGNRGVIKRYRVIRGKEWLVSESTDPNEVDINVQESGAEIFAQVIAVLKPVSEKE